MTEANSENIRPATIRGHPTTQELTIAVAVMSAAVLLSLVAGPGIGVLIVTLAVIAASLWRTYGDPGNPATSAVATADVAGAAPNPGSAIPRLLPRPPVSIPSVVLDRESIAALSIASTVGSVLAIVLAGGYLFLTDRSFNPPGFFADEAEIGVQSWKLLHWDAATSRVPFFYHHLEYSHLGSLSLVATAPFVGLFGLTDNAVRGASAFWTIAAAVVIYFALRRLAIPYAAVPVLAMLASPLVILIARVNFGHAPSLMAMSVGFFLWVVGRHGDRRWIACMGGVFIGLSAYGQSSYYVAALLFLIAIGLTEIAYNRANLRSYNALLWLGLGAVLILLPVPYRAGTDPQFLDRYEDKTVGSAQGWDRVSGWIHAYPDYLSFDLLFRRDAGNYLTRHSFPGAPFFFSAIFFFLLVGLVALFVMRGDPAQRFVWPMALVLLFFPIPDIVTRNSGDAPYSFSFVWGTIAIPFVIGYGLKGAKRLAQRFLVPKAALLYAGTILAILAVSLNGFWNGAFANYPNIAADYWGWQFGPKPATDYFKAHAGEYDEYYLSGDFNAAYILTEFFMHGSPIESVTRTGGLEFLNLSRRQLFAVRADEWERYAGSQYPSRSYLQLVATIDYPNGLPGMYLVAVDPALLQLDRQQSTTPAG